MCGPFPRFVVLDSQRGGLITGSGIKLVKLVLSILKNAIVTRGAQELDCNTAGGENDGSSSGV
jgi:hypothetical protein